MPSVSSLVLILLPVLIALIVWLTPLAFVPVPWPDDSAFYFVAKDLFQWPPRWVMLPQAPFEPTYRIWNFNTMPLFPILIGIGRWFGIDSSHAIKFWPLASFALTGSLLGWALHKRGLQFFLALLVTLALMLDPIQRWGSVLVRPESLIGLLGLALVLGLTFGFPEKLRARRLWDPVAAILAIAAYAHFNAVHLLFPLLFAWALQPRKLVETGLRTALYLTPWLITVLWYPRLFLHQMTTQWQRLNFPNDWLSSVPKAIDSLIPAMGSPEPWPEYLRVVSVSIWLLIILSIVLAVVPPLSKKLLPATGWIIGTLWLWHTKPELWFVYYVHLAAWTFAGIALVILWQSQKQVLRLAVAFLATIVLISAATSAVANAKQLLSLSKTRSWSWETYGEYVDCVDHQLIQLEKIRGSKPFAVWCPTFPDITVELSRRHPDWQLTRTNDFHDRAALAIRHGQDVDAVVVTETLSWAERVVDAPASQVPEIKSTWMTWEGYFLNKLYRIPGWKPNRHICQIGRWQAFLYMEQPH